MTFVLRYFLIPVEIFLLNTQRFFLNFGYPYIFIICTQTHAWIHCIKLRYASHASLRDIYTKYLLCKPGKFLRCTLHNVAVTGGMNDRKVLPMVAVRIGSKQAFHLVCLKIRQPPTFQNPVFCHSGIHIRLLRACKSLMSFSRRAHIHHGISHDSQRRTFLYFGISGIWHNAGKIHHFFACVSRAFISS